MLAPSPSPELLSGILRVAFTNYGAGFDIASERAKRTFQMRLHRSSHIVENEGSPQSWQELARGIPADTRGYAEHAAHYRKFLAGVALALGGESSPAEVAVACQVAFRAIQAGRAAQKGSSCVDEAKTRLPAGVGHTESKLAAEVATPALDREALKRGRIWLGAASRETMPPALASHAAAAASIFGTHGPPDEALQQMLAAHEPLELWLREHRAKDVKSRACSTLEFGESREVLPGTGWADSLAEAAEHYTSHAMAVDETEKIEVRCEHSLTRRAVSAVQGGERALVCTNMTFR